MKTPETTKPRRAGFAGTISVLALAVAAQPISAQDLTKLVKPIENYSTVTKERLVEADPSDWLLPKGNYEGWMYSELDQINKDNVKNLKPVWLYSTNLDSGHQAPAIVNDGVMFVATPYNHVLALDAATGQLFWRYEHDNPPDLAVMHNTSRGVALWGDRVFAAGLDGTLNALDARTGERLCQAEIGDWSIGAYITSAPMPVEGNILVGPSGGEFGVRGFMQATDAETCEQAWRTYSIPGPGEPGHETWLAEGPRPDAWKYGGGSMWMPGNYDAENEVVYWGVGNGSPWLGDQRPGDNLYVASVVAMDPEDGEIVGHHQYHWNDSWDWAGMNAPMLIDLEDDGETKPGLLTPQRNGYMFWLERHEDGEIGFMDGKPYVYNNAFASMDPETGRFTYDPEHTPVTGKRVGYCPSLWGGKNYPYDAYNPNTGLLYVPVNENLCNSFIGIFQDDVDPASGQFWAGIDIPDLEVTVREKGKSIGEIQAWDVNTREMVWKREYGNTMNWGSVLTTAGGLVFNAGTNDRQIRALDADTGEVLWTFPLNSTSIAPPVSYTVDGKQYIAVTAGYGVDADWTNGVIGAQFEPGEWNTDVPVGGVIWVFAVED
ncbi:MAG: PQQ-dependent dehydrogenase, methanol/ethanol family [Rhodobacteraceae bacterium]|nr:PQQ-dependent dehydrogenase, methanol/ethanol family [Paracoccaceae bacterium]